MGIHHRGEHGVAPPAVVFQNLRVGGDTAAAVIAHADKVHHALRQLGLISGFHAEPDPGAFHPLLSPNGIGAPGLDINEEVVVPVPFHGLVHIRRSAGVGIELPGGQHTAHHASGHQLMGQLHGPGAGDQLVVGRLVLHLLPVLALLKTDPGPHEGHVKEHVDLVEGEPIFHLFPEPLKEDAAVMGEGLHHPPILPSAVLLDEGDRGIEVADGHYGLDVVPEALVKEGIVEGQPLLVRCLVVAVGQYPSPGDGHSVALEVHFGKEGDVLFIMVVHVDGLVSGVGVVIVARQHLHKPPGHRHPVRPKRDHIHAGKATASLVIGALALVRGGRATPQKVLRHSHSLTPSLCNFSFIC